MVLGGDSDAFADLVRAYEARVRGLCLSLLSDPIEAEDAAQEAFVKAFTFLSRYKRDFSFPAWLCRIASNHCLDLLRKRTRHKTDSLDALVEQKGEQIHSLAMGDPLSSEGGDETIAKTKWAKQVLTSLSPDHRQILVLRELEGFSYDEISVILECSLDAVKGRLRRARQELQQKSATLLERENV